MKMKLNNKGFSLVELIIVIAITVILIGVTSAVILNYMDRTKYGKDMSALDSLNTAMRLYVGDPDAVMPLSTEEVSLKTLITGSGTVVYDPNGAIVSTLQETFDVKMSGGTVVSCTFNNESRVFDGISWENIYVNITNGNISIVAPVNKKYNKGYMPYTAGSYTWSEEKKVKK